MNKILLCSDLDRTILPNGLHPESPQALEIFTQLAAREEVTLAYVSGRSETLLKKAISDYSLPIPEYAIGDVGTTIYEPMEEWRAWDDWALEIGRDWQGKSREDLAELFNDLSELTPQEAEKQNTYKLSYYAPADIDPRPLRETIAARLQEAGARASIIWSIDEEKDVGLVDILPERATKIHAIRFLMEKKAFARERTVFAGDSGNDMEALTSGLHAVLVRNARDDVREEAMRTMEKKDMRDRLYLARGDFLGMNGNYSAGVLEGLAHFLPETRKWMETA